MLFYKIALVILGPLYFHLNFGNSLPNSEKKKQNRTKPVRIFNGVPWTPKMNLEGVLFMMLNLLIVYASICLCLSFLWSIVWIFSIQFLYILRHLIFVMSLQTVFLFQLLIRTNIYRYSWFLDADLVSVRLLSPVN